MTRVGQSVCPRCSADGIACGYAPCDAVRLESLREKLNEMDLHDDTGDPSDEGYMAAIREIREWLEVLDA